MGQYWMIVNVDKRRELRNTGGLKLWEFLVNGSAEQLVGLLNKPHLRSFKIVEQALEASKTKSPNSRLMALPQEIIDLIVKITYSTSGRHLINLALTCTYFFRLLAPTLQHAILDDSGPWAGDRLIFVGDYGRGYPDYLATPVEKSKWDTMGSNPLYKLASGLVAEGRHGAQTAWHDQHTFEVWGALLHNARAKLQKSSDKESLERFDRLCGLLTRPLETGDPATQTAVLRNLTAKKYVRDDALAKSNYAYSLGEVVTVYTTWTEDPSGIEGLPLEGEWAGHHFDISTLAEVNGNGWKDVSQEAVQMLKLATGRHKKDGRRA